MKQKLYKIITVFFLTVCFLVTDIFWGSLATGSVHPTFAAGGTKLTKPGTPVVSAKTTKSECSVKITISKTEGADGYRIYMKAPEAKSYKLIKTLAKNGTAKRSYTAKNLSKGEYSFKVRAYHVTEGKKVYGKYSKVVSVKIKAGNTDSEFYNEMISKTPATIEFADPNIFLHPLKPEDGNNPCFYSCRPKQGESIPEGAVVRLYAIRSDETGFETDLPVKIDEKEMSVLPTSTATFNLMLFAYSNEADADARKNPIARSDMLSISVQDEDDTKIYADITFKNGYAYFGSYPQAKVKDSALLSTLSKYLDQVGPECLTVDGKKYIYSDRDGGTWFEERPIEWVILEGSPESDSVTLMSNKILLECGYSDWKGYESGGRWKDSFVRYHLNRYNGSFKNIWTVDFSDGAFPGDMSRVLMTQTYDGCEDKVLLPTKAQLSKMTASERIRKADDFTRKSDKVGYWCIDSDGKGNITLVKPDGGFTTHAAYKQDGEGYVPVIKVNLKQCNIIIK